jgi:SAM-dependent methyltransferase
MDWTGGYVADIGYTAGFYRETAPGHLAFAALCLGRSPGRALQPRKVLELGFGQGFGLALLAAANPEIEFEGYDFNPEHVANARKLIDAAGITNVRVEEISFEDAAARGGANDIDLVLAHGIFTWVSRRTQDAIVDILRRRLQPDGLAYVSYNCMPGWAPVAPIRQFMREVKRRNAGNSDWQLSLALDLLIKLKNANAAFFVANPGAAQELDRMLTMDRTYLAHEYLDENWELLQFSEAAARLGEAKLTFIASASLNENIDAFMVQPELQPLLAQTSDTMLRETLRDFTSNRRFRRDIYARGSAALTPGEHRRLLSGLTFTLAVPRQRVGLNFAGPTSQLSGNEQYHKPVLDRLAGGPAAFDELLALPPYGNDGIPALLECLCLLVQSAQVMVTTGVADAEAAKRFNRMVVDSVRSGRFFFSLACPAGRTGIPVSDVTLLALAALFDGEEQPGKAGLHAFRLLKDIGRSPTKEGKLIAQEAEGAQFLEVTMRPVLEEYVPLWRQLGML